MGDKCKMFFAAHWRGVVLFVLPLILLYVPLPEGYPWQWCAYTLLLMAIFWVLEVIPLAVTGFLPMMLFPLTNVLDSNSTCESFANDTILVFLASIMLAASIEQSGLHKRLAYFAIRTIGYSHAKLLMAMCIVTTFVSMWITNTAATSMMVPIIFALLKVFEDEKIITIFETDKSGAKVSSDVTACYFCAVTFSATIGGIGTLVGTGTNLTFKSLFQTDYPQAPEYLSFPMFSAFAVPYMICLEVCCYIYIAFTYFGLFRPKSKIATTTRITDKAQAKAKVTIENETKKLGNMTFWEFMVALVFGTAIVCFFLRSPQVITGWGDAIIRFYGVKEPKMIKDSALAMISVYIMCIMPSTLIFFKNFTAKFHEDLPKTSIRSVLDFKTLNASMPYSFMYLLGGGVALSKAAKHSGLNDRIGEAMEVLKVFPNEFILFIVIITVVFITNFASNVAVINVFGPIAMTLAKKLKINPLWYIVASGYSASYCFMLAVGTPGNLIVKVVAFIPTNKMMKAGLGPTITTVLITWVAVVWWAPVIWSDLKIPLESLDWYKGKEAL